MAKSRKHRVREAGRRETNPNSAGDQAIAAMRSERRLAIGISVVLAAVTLAIYSPAVVVPFDFVDYDDPFYVTGNPMVSSGMSVTNLRWAATSQVAGNWHPLTVVSHMLDVELYGLAPRGHHLTSILLHAVNGVLLFWVMRSMMSALWPSALVAALFAWHPLRVESVAWISERKDVLSAFFLLLALAAYVRFARRGGSAPYGAMVACFALGLLSKPMLVTFPFLLLLLDVWPLARIRWLPERRSLFPTASPARIAMEKVPLLPLSALLCLATLSIQGASLIKLPFSERLAGAIQSCWAYLGKAFCPYPLYVPYVRSESGTSLVWTLVLGAGLILITVLAAVAFRRRPYLVVGWLWYLGMLVPVIGIVQVGEQSMADRYTYLPLIGIYWIIAWALFELAARGAVWRQAVVATAAVALLILTATSSLQVAHWRNTKTLFTHTVHYSPRNHVAYSALANDAYTRGEYEEALAWARSALEVKPTATGATAVMAQALAQSGKTRESIAAYQQAIAVSPNNAFLMNEFARILATCDDARFRDGQSALRIANRANALYRGQNPRILDTIAAAHAELGAWEQAVHTAEQVRAMARRSVEAGNADAQPWLNGVEVRLQLYRQQLPYRIARGVWND